jgi:hypothetical protein
MAMDNIFLHSSWTCPLTPSTIFKQATLFDLSSMQTSKLILASPLFEVFTTSLIVLMGYLWKANHHIYSFTLPIFQEDKNKMK